MERIDLTKEQFLEQIDALQDKITSLEKTVLAQSKTEDILKTSEKNLSAILEKNADGILIVDTNGIVLYVNPATEKLFGRSKEDFQGYEFGFPVSTNKEKDILTIRNGETFCEVELRIVQVNWKLKPAYQLSIRDITEHQLAEKALKDSEEKCRVIFDHANDGMFVVDLETRKFFMCNVSCIQMLDYKQDEFLNLKIADIHPAEELQRIYEQLKILSQGLSGVRGDVSFKRKNGDTFIAELSSTIIPIAGKKYVLVIFRDITERVQIGQALRESEKKIRSILENSADAIFMADESGKYTYTNKKVTAMLGFTQEEMLSKTIIDMAPQNRITEYLEIFSRLYIEGEIFMEIELLKNDGNYISTDLNAVILPNGMVYASCRDITERKRTETELIIAKNKAEESNQLKTAFLQNVSHEIRTPMNGILGFADLLKTLTILDEKQQQFIQMIKQSGLRMLNIINDIVNISQIETGQILLDLQETNVNELLKHLHTFFKPEAERKGLSLNYEPGLSDDLCNIKTDDAKLTQVISNLINNALKFSNSGSIDFGYHLKEEMLEFYIRDTGIGIVPEMQNTIFERFIQVEMSITRNYEGAGLGLAISKAFIEKLGGKIWVISKLGKGSTFHFNIPYNSKNTSQTESQKQTELKNKFKHFNILLVEDDYISRELLKEILDNEDFNLFIATNGQEALDILKISPEIQIVIMDLKMPIMDGYEATALIKELKPDLPIIAQSAYVNESDKNKAFACGCSDFISKPIEGELLLYKIYEQLHK